MDVTNKVQELIDQAKQDKKTSESSNQKDNTGFELNKIEHNLNLHLKNKQKQKFVKVNLNNYHKDTNYDAANFKSAVESEIRVKFGGKKFASLPLCLKWRCLSDYMQEQGITDSQTIADVKKNVLESCVDCEYDPMTMKIISIKMLSDR